ncbi:hypothetical protein C6503_15100 [Candidatus Poribacteria bacterium]|nr:MAG: hypothetical protein C6503_15100 [Candidatus Poribacteria bacterium]
MLPPGAAHSDSIRFEITDSDGLHQVQLFANVQLQNGQDVSILGCKSLDGSRNIVEFVPTPLVLMDNSKPLQVITDSVTLRVIDGHGNFTQHQFPIDVTPLLSRGEVVSIPDVNLAAVVRETLELPLRASITQLDMLKLTSLEAENHQITDLTGLEHAKNLRSLNLGRNQIRDVTPLAGLLQLNVLEIWQNQISDIRPLIELKRLRFLKFAENPILDTAVQLQTLRQNNPNLGSDADPKIEGPWLWMIVPTGQKANSQVASAKDWLAAASNGSVTEAQIATNGATAGERIQNRVWTLGKLAPTGGNNVGELMNTIGFGRGYIDNHVAYGSIVLDSPREQKTRMYAGSDDNHKVWINGELVHEKLNWRWAHNYQESFPVTLKQGKNVLLAAIQNGGGSWGGYFGFEYGTVYSIIGDTLPETVIRAEPVGAGPKIEGPWLWVIVPTEPRVGSRAASGKDWLAAASEDAVTETQIATNGATAGERVQNRVWTLGRLAPTGGDNVGEMLNTIGLATGTMAHHIAYGSISLDSPQEQKTWMYAGSDDNHKVWLNGELVHEQLTWHWAHDYQESFPVTLKQGENVLLVAIENEGGPWGGYFGFENDAVYSIIGDTPQPTVDVNGDGFVNILDLALVSTNLGKTGQNPADVNGDGIVNIIDLLKVAGEMGTDTAAPSAYPQTLEILTAADIRHWLIQAQHANLKDAVSQRGILILEQLLTALIPKETSLLPNYPNPFNPETWIPYQLSKAAGVALTISDIHGRVVRDIDLGHQRAGIYQTKSRAAYWNGRNAQGEPVASGVYFYTLKAGDFIATRKMLIRK